MIRLAAIIALAATPVMAASGPFVSLGNTNFVVLVSFILFVGVLLYYKVPGLLTGLLDKRADGIRGELDEARALREEAQTLLASYERKQAEVREQADRIVAHARRDAEEAAEVAKEDLKVSIARRLRAAEDRIAQAEASAVRAVRDQAIQVAVAAASDVIAAGMDGAKANALIDESITSVGAKLH